MDMLRAFYGTLAKQELSEFLVPGSFAYKVQRNLGREISSSLKVLEDADDTLWGALPVHDLYELLAAGWTLDHEWFKWTDDVYRDDDNVPIAEEIPRIYTAAEQMAAYGLYILNTEIDSMGPAPESGENEQGWTREGVHEFEAVCLIHAQQAVDFAHRLTRASEIPLKESVKKARSILGTHSANKRHSAGHAAREFVWSEWQEKKEAYGHNKSAFARTYVGIIANRFTTVKGDPLMITTRQLTESWLSSPPPNAGKPYSLLEDR